MAEQRTLEQGYNVVLKGYAYFAFLHSPQRDEEYGDKYKIDLVIENEDGTPVVFEDAKSGEEINMVNWVKENNVRTFDGNEKIPGTYIRISSKAITKDGDKRPAIPVKYNGQVLDKSTLIGNGSLVKVRALLKAVPKQKNKVGLYLDAVVVETLVPYVGAQSDEDFDFVYDVRKGNKAAKTAEAAKAQSATADSDPDFEE